MLNERVWKNRRWKRKSLGFRLSQGIYAHGDPGDFGFIRFCSTTLVQQIVNKIWEVYLWWENPLQANPLIWRLVATRHLQSNHTQKRVQTNLQKFQNWIFAECTRLTYLLSFASLFWFTTRLVTCNRYCKSPLFCYDNNLWNPIWRMLVFSVGGIPGCLGYLVPEARHGIDEES